jgi:hypothetical protein
VDVKVEFKGIEGQVGNNGILLRIREPNQGPHVGRLRIGKANLRWYPGKTSVNYKQVSMKKFIEWLDSQP